MLTDGALNFVEWPERIPGLMPTDAWLIEVMVHEGRIERAFCPSCVKILFAWLFWGRMDSGRKAIKALAREAALLPQEELLQAKQGHAELTIGIPAETQPPRKACGAGA